VGVQYDSEEGKVRLLRDVRMSLATPKSGAAGKKATKGEPVDPVHVNGEEPRFCAGHPADAPSRSCYRGNLANKPAAGELTLVLDSAFHAEKL